MESDQKFDHLEAKLLEAICEHCPSLAGEERMWEWQFVQDATDPLKRGIRIYCTVCDAELRVLTPEVKLVISGPTMPRSEKKQPKPKKKPEKKEEEIRKCELRTPFSRDDVDFLRSCGVSPKGFEIGKMPEQSK